MLEEFKQRAIRAHNGTSFDPERRGENLVKEFEETLASDLDKIKEATGEQKSHYVAKFKSLFSAWLGAKSNCISTMIAGPSNFPVRRAEKANRSEDNKYQLFSYWRQKAIKAIIKSTLPERNALEEAKINLAERIEQQDLYKKINQAHRNYLKKPSSLDKTELAEGVKKMIRNFVPQYSWIPSPIAPYQMTNNNANIKRLEVRVQELEQKEAARDKENEEIPFKDGVIILNYSIDRIQVKHAKKPERPVIDSLKQNGFHWSPSQMAWQRQISNVAIYKASILTGTVI
jgi:hypothetical protein